MYRPQSPNLKPNWPKGVQGVEVDEHAKKAESGVIRVWASMLRGESSRV